MRGPLDRSSDAGGSSRSRAGGFLSTIWLVPLGLAGSRLPSVSVSVSIHPGTTPLPRCQSSLYPQASEQGSGRERVGTDLESA